MAGVVLVILVCQVMPVFFHPDFPALLPLLFALLAALATGSLFQQVETMEV